MRITECGGSCVGFVVCGVSSDWGLHCRVVTEFRGCNMGVCMVCLNLNTCILLQESTSNCTVDHG